MLDGFLGYNQVAAHPNDKKKTTFTTPWGTFIYDKMCFGLMNVAATFQREIVIAFPEEKEEFLVTYLDDITIYSKNDQDHLEHLRRVFQNAENLASH